MAFKNEKTQYLFHHGLWLDILTPENQPSLTKEAQK